MSDAGRCRGGVFTLDGGGGHGSGGKSRVIRSGKGKGREEGLFIFVYFLTQFLLRRPVTNSIKP